MLRFQFIETMHYPSSQARLYLFQDRDSGEVVLLACQLANLFGYHSLSRLLRYSDDCHQPVHFSVLEKQPLREFKNYLAQLQLPDYRHCRSLLLITETGIAYLLGKHCKSQALRVGEWLLRQVFPTLRRSLPMLYYQNVNSLYLDVTLGVIIVQGRCGIFSRQLTALLNTLPLDHVDRGCHGYIEHIHLAIWDRENYRQLQGLLAGLPEEETPPLYFFYESGIYRYLNNISHPLVPLLKLAFEREIFPWCRRLASQWPAESGEDSPGDADSGEPVSIFDEEIDASRPMPVLEPTSGWPSPSGRREMQEVLVQIRRLEEMQREYQQKLHLIEREQQTVKESLSEQNSTLTTKLDSLHSLLQKLSETATSGQRQAQIVQDTMPSDSPSRSDEAEKRALSQEKAPKLSLTRLKQVAESLGLYYLDKITPHLVFVRELIDYAGTSDQVYLQWIITGKLKMTVGPNRVQLGDKSFHVWKSQ